MPFAVTFSLQYLVGAIKSNSIYMDLWCKPSSPSLCLMHRARMLFIEEISEFCLSAFFSCFLQEKFHHVRKFPLFIFSSVHSTFNIHKLFFLVGKQIFLWFWVSCRRNNGGVRDQLLNSVCWFFSSSSWKGRKQLPSSHVTTSENENVRENY